MEIKVRFVGGALNGQIKDRWIARYLDQYVLDDDGMYMERYELFWISECRRNAMARLIRR